MKNYSLILIITVLIGLTACSNSENGNPNVDEICNDGVDNDGNGLVDCEDMSCSSNKACFESNCADGIDNDGDGFSDCEDLDCEDFQDCLIERCIDGVDNDGDGLVDCEDPDCTSNPNCN